MGRLHKTAFYLWVFLLVFIIIGIAQQLTYHYTGSYLTFNPVEIIEKWGPLGFVVDALLIGLFLRWWVRRKNRKNIVEASN